jgi:hypothetical protein
MLCLIQQVTFCRTICLLQAFSAGGVQALEQQQQQCSLPAQLPVVIEDSQLLMELAEHLTQNIFKQQVPQHGQAHCLQQQQAAAAGSPGATAAGKAAAAKAAQQVDQGQYTHQQQTLLQQQLQQQPGVALAHLGQQQQAGLGLQHMQQVAHPDYHKHQLLQQ